jgi:putative heme transporter
VIVTAIGLGVLVAFVFAVLPQIAGFGSTLKRLKHGNKAWLIAGLGLESLSLGGYMMLFRLLFTYEGVRIDWKASYAITMAGTVASKVLSAAGAGGVALTVWALHAAGLDAKAIARRMAAFEILLYAVYMGSLVIFGLGLAVGVFSGRAPPELTLLPAGFGAVVIGLAIAMYAIPDDVETRFTRLASKSRRGKRVLAKLATIPRTLHEGMQTALEVVRRPRPGLFGAVAYWGFDIATLGVAFAAFGHVPPVAVLVVGYFLGQLANVLPLPGGVGGVESGMIGAFIAFGVNGSVAVLAVLAYRAISFWLPMIPGLAAYFQLRGTVNQWREQHPEDHGEEERAAPVAS